METFQIRTGNTISYLIYPKFLPYNPNSSYSVASQIHKSSVEQKMVKEIKSFKLFGRTITVFKTRENESTPRRRFMEKKNIHVFKHRGSIAKPQSNRGPVMKFSVNVIEAIKSAGGTNLTFLMDKKLKETDIDKYQNRIYVAKNRELMGYLTECEKQSAGKQGIDGGLDVTVIDPRAEIYKMKLKQWTNSNKYALIKEWGKLVRDNGLRKDDSVEIWCFRVDLKFYLVVNTEMRVDWGEELRLS